MTEDEIAILNACGYDPKGYEEIIEKLNAKIKQLEDEKEKLIMNYKSLLGRISRGSIGRVGDDSVYCGVVFNKSKIDRDLKALEGKDAM
jgi:hypothetical protein